MCPSFIIDYHCHHHHRHHHHHHHHHHQAPSQSSSPPSLTPAKVDDSPLNLSKVFFPCLSIMTVMAIVAFCKTFLCLSSLSFHGGLLIILMKNDRWFKAFFLRFCNCFQHCREEFSEDLSSSPPSPSPPLASPPWKPLPHHRLQSSAEAAGFKPWLCEQQPLQPKSSRLPWYFLQIKGFT